MKVTIKKILKITFAICVIILIGFIGYGSYGYFYGAYEVKSGFDGFVYYINRVFDIGVGRFLLLLVFIYSVAYLIHFLKQKRIQWDSIFEKKLLKLSLIPYIGILGAGIFSMFFGIEYQTMGSVDGYFTLPVFGYLYGLDALKNCIQNYIYAMRPLLIVCLIYQLFYFLYKLCCIIKKHKSKNVVADNNSELQDKN